MNASSKPIPASETPIGTSVGFAMWRRFRKPWVSEAEKVRGGGGPLDNLVVLITSLTLIAVLGVGLLRYFGYWPDGHPTLTEHG